MAKVAKWTMLYYGSTTVAAVLLGIGLVSVVNPGRGSPFSGNLAANCGMDQVKADLAHSYSQQSKQTSTEQSTHDMQQQSYQAA